MSAEITATISEVLKQWADERQKKAVETLDSQFAVKPLLGQSITTTELKVEGLNIGIGFTADDYYIYLDEGVKGLKNARKNSGVFSFKTPFPSRDMIKNLEDYIPRYGIVPSGGGKKKTIPKKEKAAIGIAFAVKQLGIAQKPFWKPTFNEAAFNDLAARLEEALGGDINLTLTIE
jgi:hypothetical protein